MILRHVRALTALTFLTLAVTASAGLAVSQAAITAPPAPSAGHVTGPQERLASGCCRRPPARPVTPGPACISLTTWPRARWSTGNSRSVTWNGPLHVTVYPAAATIGQGGFQFAAGHTQNEMTPWVRISQTTVNLAPHSAATLTATIAVPHDAPSGSQYGVIWAEQDTTGSGNVLLVSRVGIRLYLSIGPGGAPAPNFTVGTPTVSHTSGGSPIVHVPVHNTGGVALDVRGTLQLTGGPGGLQDGPFPAASVDTLAPGQAHPATFALSSKIPACPWQATFTFTSGLITKTEKVTLNLGGGAPVTAAHTSFPIVPVVAGIAAVILLAVVVLIVRRVRRTPRLRGT